MWSDRPGCGPSSNVRHSGSPCSIKYRLGIQILYLISVMNIRAATLYNFYHLMILKPSVKANHALLKCPIKRSKLLLVEATTKPVRPQVSSLAWIDALSLFLAGGAINDTRIEGRRVVPSCHRSTDTLRPEDRSVIWLLIIIDLGMEILKSL